MVANFRRALPITTAQVPPRKTIAKMINGERSVENEAVDSLFRLGVYGDWPDLDKSPLIPVMTPPVIFQTNLHSFLELMHRISV